VFVLKSIQSPHFQIMQSFCSLYCAAGGTPTSPGERRLGRDASPYQGSRGRGPSGRVTIVLACLVMAGFSASAAPTIDDVDPPAGTVFTLAEITVRFSESVVNVFATDLLANGNPAVAVSGSGMTYTFTLERQPDYGTVQITWDPSHDIRSLSNQRFDETLPESRWEYDLVDTTAPIVASRTPVAGASVRTLTQIEVVFTEPVSGVDAADLTINGAPATGLEVLGVGRYRFTFPPPPTGTVAVVWAIDSGIQDFAAQPNNFGGGSWNYTLDPNLGVPQIRISEFLASNVSGLRDENGEAQDWIELHNYGPSTVNLGGYALTDDSDDPGRWVFPSTNLAPNQFLVVFASGKDRRAPTSVTNRLHTNFKLGAGGDYLGLFNGESPRVVIAEFAPEYPEQRNDFSYGYTSTGTLRYFENPTPGAANGESDVTRILPPPHFNVARGYFEAPFTLVLSIPVYGATIRYTRDGSEPAATNGIVYTQPITISNTTVIRAAATKPNFVPSETVTHTYLYLSTVPVQSTNPPGYPVGATVFGGFPADYGMDPEIVTNSAYGSQLLAALKSLPSVSVATSIDNMFGPTNGIYTHVAESQTTYRGVAWERACSVEFLPNETSEPGFQVNCGIRMQGNASRNPQKTPKHPMRLLFKSDYGPGRLEYPLYPDSPVQSFNTLVMRADFNNSWLHWNPDQRARGTRIRDGWVKDTWRAMGQPGSHTRYFHLYINGLYWGIYDFGERIDAEFAASYLGGEGADYDAIVSKPTEALDGDIAAYNAMVNVIRNRDLRVLSNYLTVLDHLDVPNFCDYMLLNFYGGNQDWGRDSNWNAVRRRSPDGRFKYISWDGEQLIVNVNDNRVSNVDVPGDLHTSLINSPEYRLAFADRAHKHLFNGGALTTNEASARWQKRASEVDLPVIAESARWGDYRRDVHQYQNPPYILYTRNTGTTNWMAEINRLRTSYFPQRGNIFLQQLRNAGLYPSTAVPVFNRHGGFVARGFNLTMTATNPVYFTTDGADPRVFGSGLISPSALEYTAPLVLSNSVLVKARALFGTNWSALAEAEFAVDALVTPLRITEIMYHPSGGDAYEFIELQNVSGAPVSIGNFTVDGIGDYIFPPGTVLAPGQIIVLGSDNSPGNWSNRYPGIVAFGRFDGKLDNGGEKLAVKNASGQVLWSVDYNDSGGWPLAADGGGYSIEIIDPFGDPDDPANWRASGSTNGTPGVISSPPAPVVVLNEVMADNISAVNNGGLYPDWVELHNPGAAPIDIGNWSLSDDAEPRAFVFPENTTIPGNGYLVVWCDTNTAVTGLRASFGLGRNGDSVFLFDANTNRIDAVGFGVQASDYTVGLVNGQWQLTQPTPGQPNSAVALGSITNVVINEWLANAVPGGDDWIELHNGSATQPVSLIDLHLGTSNTTYQLSALSFIAPGGFVQLLADENPGANHLDFKLPAAGGAIVLYDTAGLELQRVVYSAQPQGVSEGRLPDAADAIVSFPTSPSPGASNYRLEYGGPFINEVLALASRRVAGARADFIELRNTNATPYDLSGMRLSNDPETLSQWVFPSGASVPANGLLVVWFDNDEPPSTNAASTLNTGQSLDSESGEVWLFNAAGQPVDSVVFGFQVADMPLGRTETGDWVLLTAPTPGAGNDAVASLGAASTLQFNEWLANSPEDDDWFELYNAGSQPVLLSGLFLSDSPAAAALRQFEVPPLSFIGAKGFVRWSADGHPSNGRNHVNFSLDADGETLRLYSTLGVIDTVYFGLQESDVSEGRLPDGASAITRFPYSPTPAESNYLPLPNALVNEVLTNPQVGSEQFIEVHNPTAFAADVSGWYLSDSQQNFQKYRTGPSTTLPAHGYLVFQRNQFDGGAGSLIPFAFDPALSGEAWLSAADAFGNLTGYRSGVRFGASERQVSFVRYTTTIQQDHFVAAEAVMPGAANAAPRVGPVVINEIMYHPPEIIAGVDNVAYEFIELYNTTTNPIPLYDPAATTNTWRLGGGVAYTFPPGVSLNSRAYLLVVSFNPVTDVNALISFRSAYGIPLGVAIFGPYTGKLDNGGEEVQLFKPSTANDGPTLAHVLVEQIDYDDVFPWPLEPDAGGSSLQRRRPYRYPNDPANWKGFAPTPGRANIGGSSYGDFDRDGMPDSWEAANNLNASSAADANLDADADGRTSYEEFLDGTNPQSAASRLNAPVIATQPQDHTSFPGSNVTFSVTVTGSEPLSYQWRFNEKPILSATAPTLSLSDIDVPNSGLYDVVVWNGGGYALSDAATLAVHALPRIVTQPQSQIVNSNANVTLSVVAEGGTGTLRYQWQLNGNNILNATNATYAIAGAQLVHEGNYRALVSDDNITIPSAVARLTVRIRPFVLVHPVGSTNPVGSSISLSVLASGSVPMSFLWRRGTTPLGEWQILDTTNSSITLNNLRTNDSGDYRVIITNYSGFAVFSSIATVLVVGPPQLVGTAISGEGDVTFGLRGISGQTYAIETSSNLTQWATITNIVSTNALMPVVDRPTGRHQFYRARYAP
jgi:hypothetical protein